MEADERGAERPRVATMELSLPSDLAALAKRVAAAFPATKLKEGRGGGKSVRVPVSHHAQLRALLDTEHCSLASRHPIERHALEYSPKLSEAEATNVMAAALPEELRSRLFEFQREGVVFALRHGGRALIADEMGLGKTVQAICVALCYAAEWPLLIVCPASLCVNWRTELVKWMDLAGIEEPAARIHVVKNGKDHLQADCEDIPQSPQMRASIISYDLAKSLAPQLHSIGFGICVCDESHTLKSPSAARTKAILPLASSCKRTLLLSGTPVLSRPIEIYTQAAALRPQIFGTQRDFGIRYAAGHYGRWGWDEKGASHTEALCAVLTHTLMIRREKAAVLTQLPDKFRCKLALEIASADRREITDKLLKLQRETADDSERDGPAIQHHPLVTELYQRTGLAKVAAVSSHVATLLAPTIDGGGATPKLLLFAHHQKVLDGLAAALEKSSTPYVRIDGQVDVNSRQAECDRFQTDPRIRVALLSISAAGVGLTLTAASLVLFAEVSWEIGKLRQAEDRAHRIGQKASVMVQYCLAEGTLDDWMWRTIERKLEVTTATMDGKVMSNPNATMDGNKGTSQSHAEGGASAKGDLRSWLGRGDGGGSGGGSGSGGRLELDEGDGTMEEMAPPPRVRLHEALGHSRGGPSDGGGAVQLSGSKRSHPEVIDLLAEDSEPDSSIGV